MTKSAAVHFLVILTCSSLASFADESRPNVIEEAKSFPQKRHFDHLPNSVQIHPNVISGSVPASDQAFEELVKLGVKTIISVDGARPNVEAAKRYGLRYVHLPHGYAGVPQQRVMELAKAFRDFDGPIYIHCHHGKQRSPAAASVACVANGMIPPAEARTVLELAGTDYNYRGLYQSADQAKRISDATLTNLEVEFREIEQVPLVAEAMVEIERVHHELGLIAAAGWKSPNKYPNLDPAHEALMLREHFSELLRIDETQSWPLPMLDLLRSAEADAEEFESQLRSGAKASKRIQTAKRITAHCKACHQQFRDAPFSEQ